MLDSSVLKFKSYKVTFFFDDGSTSVFRLNSWYCRPQILSSLSFCLHRKYKEFVMLRCDRYSSMSFPSVSSPSYPVSDVFFSPDNDFIIPLFGGVS